jgi:ABC-2 type transport system permease protein
VDTEYTYDAGLGERGQLTEAILDLAAGARLWRTWGLLGWRDFRHQTNRTIIGPLWTVVGMAVTVGALGYVYGALLSWPPRTGYPFLAAGLLAWFFISGSIQGGCSVFINAAGILQERPLPISFNIYRFTWRLFIEFGIKFLVFVITALAVWFNPGLSLLYILPILPLYFLNALWVIQLFGMIGTRYRDFPQLVNPLMLIAFLTTPILWPQSALNDQQFIGTYNPLTHFIDILREPLLGNPPPLGSIVVVGAIMIVGWIVTLFAFARFKNRIVFWL